MRPDRILAVSALALVLAAPALASTPTAHYSWAKPVVGAEADTWGAEINTDLDGIDTAMFGKLDLAGGVMTGTLTVAGGTTTVAPMKLQAGSLLTTPVAHALEWDGSHLFVTKASGPTRTQLANLSDVQTFTGAITFAGALTGNLTGAITGNAATATALASARTLSYSGDATGGPTAFDGSANVSTALTLAASGVTAGAYGDAGHVAQLSVNAKGLVTSAASVAITGTLPAQSGAAAANLGNALTTNGAAAAWTGNAASAWALITAGAGGCTVAAGYNVASCSRVSQGLYALSFTQAMADTHYIWIGSAGGSSSNFAHAVVCQSALPASTSGFTVGVVSSYDSVQSRCGGGGFDADYLYLAVFGN